MKLYNSYVFLKNPYKKIESTDKDGNQIIVIGNNISDYIKKSFPSVLKAKRSDNDYVTKYTGSIQIGDDSCDVEFRITEVTGIKYLDIFVAGKTRSKIIRFMEYIHETLLNSGVKEYYIDIISYDAISEHYCNKISGKLNSLERLLRKLLFNIYILNFGIEYYQATMDPELQNKIKGLINSSNKETLERIRQDYHLESNRQAKEIDRLQQFFYSFEFADIQKFLFKPNWTSVDEAEKNAFLAQHKNLSNLSDSELRNALLRFSPKSDWERFFSSKVSIAGIETLIDELRSYRNIVAHHKLFYKADYEKCNKLINRLNAGILKAIQLTEEIDFVEKNAKALQQSLSYIAQTIDATLASLRETIQIFQNDSLISAAQSIINSFRIEPTWFKKSQEIASILSSSINHSIPPILKEAQDATREFKAAFEPLTLSNTARISASSALLESSAILKSAENNPYLDDDSEESSIEESQTIDET